MAYRKVTLNLKVKIQIIVDESIEISEVINNMDYNFESDTEGANISDTEILDYEIIDSK